jgi:hypothetical protein
LTNKLVTTVEAEVADVDVQKDTDIIRGEYAVVVDDLVSSPPQYGRVVVHPWPSSRHTPSDIARS